jgi:hypothetical protein
MRHAGIDNVVDITAAALNESGVLETRNALADGEFTHVAFNLWNSCVTGPVTRREGCPGRVNLL